MEREGCAPRVALTVRWRRLSRLPKKNRRRESRRDNFQQPERPRRLRFQIVTRR